MSQYPFKVEYAKSGRSACKECRMSIGNGELRFGIMIQSQRFDGRIPTWHHANCFWLKVKNRIEDISDLHGFERLRWEDQEKITEQLNNASTHLDDTGSSFSFDYAKSSSSKCRLCDKNIAKNSLRLCNKKMYYHVDCALAHTNDIGLNSSLNEITGFENLNDEDKSRYSNFTILRVPPDVQVKPEMEKNGTNIPSSCDPAAINKENLKKQTNDLWQTIDILNENLSNDDMAMILEQNGQRIPVKSEIAERVADCLLFGALLPCPECNCGQLAYNSSHNAYVCTGFMSAYTSCQFKTQNPERSSVCLSADLRESCDYLADYNFVPGRKRLFPSLISGASQKNSGIKRKSFDDNDCSNSNSTSNTTKMILKDGSAVDPDSNLASVAHVYQDENKEKFFAILNAVDIITGRNSYYKLQLLERDKTKRYHLFRAWGRIGTSIGDTKIENFGSNLESAKQAFMDLYFEKTGNEWDDRHEFVMRRGKFKPVQVDYESDEILKLEKKPKISNSTLPVPIQNFVSRIFDIEQMKDTMKEFEIDLKKMPLGKISKNQIKSAYDILSKLEQCLQNPTKSYNTMVDLTNQFYSVVPHDFGMDIPPLINSSDQIQSKTTMLDNLMEIELAFKILRADIDDGRDPVDVHYQQLKAEFQVLESSSFEYKFIDEYVKNSHGATHTAYTLEIDQVFSVKRQGESELFTSKCKRFKNKMLLWHGSRTTNFAGIVSNGLRIAPPEAPSSGYMFGKGIYFADMVSKSANYCNASRKDNYGYVLLCEVALGNIYEVFNADSTLPTNLPKNKHSVKGCGQTVPDPSGFFTTDNGTIVPKGPRIPSDYTNLNLLYNEFVVYDVAQVNMKYIVKLKFNFTC